MQSTGARREARRVPQVIRIAAVAGAVAVFVAACSSGTTALRGAGELTPVASGSPTAGSAGAPSRGADEAAVDAARPAVTPSPSTRPTTRPTTRPVAEPAARPAAKPSTRPTTKPAARPAAKPSTRPTTKPAARPTTRPTTKPAPEPGAAGGMSAAEAEVLRLVNAERAGAGCGALRSHAVLLRVARAHSKDMGTRGYFAHDSQDGRSPFDRMRAAGYRGGAMAENIAAGQPTAAAVMKAWMNSPGHRANILDCRFRVIGVGAVTVAGSPLRIYWTQNFGDR